MNRRYKTLKPFYIPTAGDFPVDWEAVFGRPAPIEIEMGFGDGEYLARCAEENPKVNWLGLELRWSCVHRALRRIDRAKLENVRVMHLDIRAVLKYLFGPRSVAGIRAMFPSPWPKRKSVRKRTFDRPFLDLARNRLEDGGEIHLVTDQESYANWILERTGDGTFEVERKRGVPGVDTRYERKWREEGVREFQEIRFRKKVHATGPDREGAKMKTHRIAHFDPERFAPVDEPGEISVVFKDYLYDPKRRKAMVGVFLSEDGFQKDFWVRIEYRGEEWHIGPASWQEFLPTRSAQRALDLVRLAAESNGKKTG